MAYPDPYEKVTNYSMANLSDLRAGLDGDFDDIQQASQEVVDFLGLAITSTGKLQNNSVTVDTLAEEVYTLFAAGWTARGDWVEATSYAAGDAVNDGGYLYVAITAHTSSVVSFASDYNTGYWQRISRAIELQAVSATSILIGTGSKVFTVAEGKFFPAGGYVMIQSDANPLVDYMFAQIDTYSVNTLTVTVTTAYGSGTHTDWTISFSGAPGQDGADGSAGTLDFSTVTNENAPSVADYYLFNDVSAGANRKTTLLNAFGAISTLTLETVVDTNNDVFLMYDVSEGAANKVYSRDIFRGLVGLTTDTTPDGNADYLMTYDNSAAAAKKVLPVNLMKVIADLTALTAPDGAVDYIPIYDDSAAVAKKILPTDFFTVITDLTSLTAPDGAADSLALYDNSAGVSKKILGNNFLKIINDLAADSSPDNTADYVATYDASGTAAKKVLLRDVNRKSSVPQIGQNTTTGATTMTLTGIAATHKDLIFKWDNMSCTVATRILQIQVSAGNGFNNDVFTVYFKQVSGTTNSEGNASDYRLFVGTAQAAAGTCRGELRIYNYTESNPAKFYRGWNIDGAGVCQQFYGFIDAVGAIDGVMAYWNSTGNFDGSSTLTAYGTN